MLAPPLEPTGETKLAGSGTSDASGKVAVASATEGNPFDDQVWRAEGGSDGEAEVRVRPDSADAELAGAHPVIAGNPIREALGAFVKNKRNLAIAAGGVVVLIVLIVVTAGGGSKSKHRGKQQVAQKETTKETKHETPPQPEAPAAGSDSNAAGEAGSAEAASGSDSGSAATTEPAESGSAAKTPTSGGKSASGEPEKKKTGAFGGKQVVLDYDTQAREAKPVAGATQAEQSAIAKARGAYATGNSKLFAGDAEGAIKAYHQALADYPAYVAGYRGLGLAYAQKGDNAKAVQALRTYVNTVPSAKDAAIIRKRIQMLSGK